jgi:ABC-type dipeptide/oligopeptide/nickel transport system permease subunit
VTTAQAAQNSLLAEGSLARTNQRSLWGDAMRRMVANRLTLVGLVLTIGFLVIAVIGPYITPYSYTEQDYTRLNETPTWDHLLGTDELGRDFLSRILYGARTAGLVSLIVTILSTVVGVALGSIAAFSGGWVDGVIVRVIDVTMTIPTILLAALASTVLKKPLVPYLNQLIEWGGLPRMETTAYIDYFIVIGAIALISWEGKARLIRGQILSLRNELYVEAARCVGANPVQILWRHVIPNAMGPVVVAITFTMAGAITMESSLSFLGLGIQPPGASWGSMIASALGIWRFRPWLLAAPALVLGLVTLAIQFLGDGLNDALDPRRTI